MKKPSITSLALSILLAAVILPALVSADTIAMIGTGDVSSALGPRFAELGHTIVYGSRDPNRERVKALVVHTGQDASATTPAEAAADADIVVLAVPGAVIETVTKGLGDLAGKIIIDPTNALRRRDDGLFEMAVETSNAELIQGWAPDAFVVKAFNTLNWRQMADPESAGGPVSIPLVGDSAEAKAVVATLVEGIGLEPIDLGPVRYAHVVEGMLVLWVNSRFVNGQPFEFHLREVESK
jgi:predicted dinucleotide-binding enzyme